MAFEGFEDMICWLLLVNLEYWFGLDLLNATSELLMSIVGFNLNGR